MLLHSFSEAQASALWVGAKYIEKKSVVDPFSKLQPHSEVMGTSQGYQTYSSYSKELISWWQIF